MARPYDESDSEESQKKHDDLAWNRLFGYNGLKPKSDVHMKALREAFVKAASPEDVAEITKAIIERAKDGDATCAALIYDRLFGKTIKPVVQHEVQQQTEEDHAEFLGKLKNVVGLEVRKAVKEGKIEA